MFHVNNTLCISPAASNPTEPNTSGSFSRDLGHRAILAVQIDLAVRNKLLFLFYFPAVNLKHQTDKSQSQAAIPNCRNNSSNRAGQPIFHFGSSHRRRRWRSLCSAVKAAAFGALAVHSPASNTAPMPSPPALLIRKLLHSSIWSLSPSLSFP